MSHTNPLAAYARHKDAEAFAQIVDEYHRLIFATCRRTLHDPADVDDAVQETFLRLARRAAQLRSNLGGWLHRCAVNVSRDINRRRATRGRHETAAAEGGPPRSNRDAGQELAELREHLDAALQKLDPEDRELIIQRFFVGRPQVELAAESGVAASTLNGRIDRAVGALRAQLKRMGCIAVVAGGTAGVVSAMQAEHASAAMPKAMTAKLMQIGLSGVGGAGAGALATKMLAALAATLLLAAGAWVAVAFLTGNGPWSAARSAAIVGGAAPATQAGSSAVTVNSGNSAAPAQPNWQPTPDVSATAVLAGRVLDPAGKPIAGARVTLAGAGGRTTTTDDRGVYAFEELGSGGDDYGITVEARGFLPVYPWQRGQPKLNLSPASHARRDFVLDRGINLIVTVADPHANPIRNAVVDYIQNDDPDNQPPMLPSASDRTGTVKLLLPVCNSTYTIFCRKAGYAPAHVIIAGKSADAAQSVRLTMEPGQSFRGVAICSDKKPAAGWSVYAEPQWWPVFRMPDVSPIDKEGNFTLHDMAPGSYSIWIERGNEGSSVGTMAFPPATQPFRLDLPMVSPASLVKVTGIIRFVGGKPEQPGVNIMNLTGAREFIEPDLQPGPAPDEMRYTFSAAPGYYRIDCGSPSTDNATIDKIKLPGALPVLTLHVLGNHGKARLGGTVTDAKSKLPIAHFAVRVRKLQTLGDGANYGQDENWVQTSDPNGCFGVDCAGPGIYQVQVSVDGYAWMWSKPVRLEQGHMTQDIELPLMRGGSLRGTVIGPAGKPVAGAKVIPLSMARTLAMGYEDRFEGEAGAVRTDAHGSFLLPHLAGGGETLKVVDSRFAPQIVRELTVIEGKTADAGTIVMHVGGSVAGIVYDSSGKPAPGLAVEFQDAGGYGGEDDERAGRLASVTTDNAGRYRIDHLPEEVTWVDLANRWMSKGVVRRVVRPLDGKTANLDFGGDTPVKGRLLANGRPCADADVQLCAGQADFGSVDAFATTDADGHFTFLGPPPGHYTLYWRRAINDSDWTTVQNVNIDTGSVDLGTIDQDIGDVTITVAADDPALVSDVRYLDATTDLPNRVWQPSVCRVEPVGDHRRAAGLPAGHYRLHALLKQFPTLDLSMPFERKSGAANPSITMRLPSAFGKLNLIDTAALPPDNHLVLRNADSTVEVTLHFADKATATATLPAGSYRVLDQATQQPRADIAAIEVKDRQTVQVRDDFFKPAPNPVERIAVAVWTADGVLVTSSPKLIDPAGNAAPCIDQGDISAIFLASPGRWRVLVDRGGAEPFEKDVAIAPPRPGNANGVQLNIVLP